MYFKIFALGTMAIALPLFSQSTEEFTLVKKPSPRAARSGANWGGGDCEIIVRIDNRAYVELQNERMRVRTLEGAPSYNDGSWCSGAIPTMPQNFQFRQMSGRGRSRLEQMPSPSNGGITRIYVEDPQAGSASYRFALSWDGGSGGNWGGGWGGSGGSGGGWGGSGGSGGGWGGSNWSGNTWNGNGRGQVSYPTTLQVMRVSMDVRGDQVEIRANPSGAQQLLFRGRVMNSDASNLEVNVDSCVVNGRQERCDGRARVRGRSGTIDFMELDARSSDGDPLRLRFNR